MPHSTLNSLSGYGGSAAAAAQGSTSSEAEADGKCPCCCCSVTGNALGKCQFVIGNQLGFPGNSAGKESTCNAGDLDLTPGLERSPGEGNGYPLQYSFLGNLARLPGYSVHGVTKSWTQLSYFHFSFSSRDL